jgi:hypothetical protein
MPRSPKKQKTDSESVSSGSSTAVTDDPRNRPVRILCYFDESHTLNGESVAAPHDAEVPYRTLYQTLCYSLDQLCNLDMFGIFLSTHSNLASYCPPQRFFWSARGVNAPLIPMQAPFTELPFDVWQKDGRPAIVEGDMSLTDVCKHHVMARFGRPLLVSSFALFIAKSLINV